MRLPMFFCRRGWHRWPKRAIRDEPPEPDGPIRLRSYCRRCGVLLCDIGVSRSCYGAFAVEENTEILADWLGGFGHV